MKVSFTGVLALLAGAFAVHAQGQVSLANYDALVPYIYVSFKPSSGPSELLGGSSTGVAPTLSNYSQETGNGNDWTIQLYGAAGSDVAPINLIALPGATAFFANGVNDATAGTWYSTALGTIQSISLGGTVTVQLYAWYNDGGTITSYAQAVANAVPAGFSNPGNVGLYFNLNGTPPPSPLPQTIGNFNLFMPIPEPSTMALGVIGASTFLLRLCRHRKN